MNKKKIYDIPTRLFHWLFAGLFISAFLIAKNIDDDSPIYAYHMLIGMTMTVTVLLRIVWGIIGSRWAKFSSFALQHYALLGYTKDIFISKTKRYIGHNPASSWAALIMMALTFGLAGTGYMMT